MRNIRGAQKHERDWLAREATQRCTVCGRRFILRAEKVCSRECLAKLKERAKQQKAKAP
jgi:hypothetical protein